MKWVQGILLAVLMTLFLGSVALSCGAPFLIPVAPVLATWLAWKTVTKRYVLFGRSKDVE